MSEDVIVTVSRRGRSYMVECQERDLQIRGPHLDWVLQAAADIIANVDRLATEGDIETLAMLAEFEEDESNPVDLDVAKQQLKDRFKRVPQCGVTYHGEDFRWVPPEARAGSEHVFLERISDQSLMREGSWLDQQD